jgi:hypothetical protein
MIIYLASGYTITNVPGLEEKYARKYYPCWSRLISFYDIHYRKENNVQYLIELNKQEAEEWK